MSFTYHDDDDDGRTVASDRRTAAPNSTIMSVIQFYIADDARGLCLYCRAPGPTDSGGGAAAMVLVSKKFAWIMRFHRICRRKSIYPKIRRGNSSFGSWDKFVTENWEQSPALFRADSLGRKQFRKLESALLEAPFIARACPPLECDNLDVEEVLREAYCEGGLGGPPQCGQVLRLIPLIFGENIERSKYSRIYA